MGETIRTLEEKIRTLTAELAAERRRAPHEPVGEYTFRNGDGSPVTLAELFGERTDLLVVHNMGRACVYCTLWADGLKGFVPHLESRTALVLASPDDPPTMSRFAAGRGWNFRTVSSMGSPFGKDMGFEKEPGKFFPGVSAFAKRPGGAIVRTGRADFGPGDSFCALWPFLELLDQGVNGWTPKYSYEPGTA